MDNLKRILLVDDDAGTLETLTASLRDLAEIDTAPDAHHALRQIRDGSYDVILSEIQTPDMSGIELLRQIRRLQPDARVIMMAGEHTPDTVVKSIQHQAFSCLCKPFAVEVLRDAVQVALDADHREDDIVLLSGRLNWISLSVRCKMELADRILHFLRCMKTGLGQEEQDNVAIAFRELLINAIEHGGHSDPGKRVHVSFVRTAGALIYHLQDPGDGFSFDNIPHAAISNKPDEPVRHAAIREELGIRPGGFGLLLTRNLVDELVYNEKGNEVMLVKYLKSK